MRHRPRRTLLLKSLLAAAASALITSRRTTLVGGSQCAMQQRLSTATGCEGRRENPTGMGFCTAASTGAILATDREGGACPNPGCTCWTTTEKRTLPANARARASGGVSRFIARTQTPELAPNVWAARPQRWTPGRALQGSWQARRWQSPTMYPEANCQLTPK